MAPGPQLRLAGPAAGRRHPGYHRAAQEPRDLRTDLGELPGGILIARPDQLQSRMGQGRRGGLGDRERVGGITARREDERRLAETPKLGAIAIRNGMWHPVEPHGAGDRVRRGELRPHAGRRGWRSREHVPVAGGALKAGQAGCRSRRPEQRRDLRVGAQVHGHWLIQPCGPDEGQRRNPGWIAQGEIERDPRAHGDADGQHRLRQVQRVEQGSNVVSEAVEGEGGGGADTAGAAVRTQVGSDPRELGTVRQIRPGLAGVPAETVQEQDSRLAGLTGALITADGGQPGVAAGLRALDYHVRHAAQPCACACPMRKPRTRATSSSAASCTISGTAAGRAASRRKTRS